MCLRLQNILSLVQPTNAQIYFLNKDAVQPCRLLRRGFLCPANQQRSQDRQCNASRRSVRVLLLHPTEWFTAPFGASTFDKDPQATRLTMELDVTNSSILTLLQQMDQWAVQAVASSGLFENMSKEDVARMYHPCLQTSEKYNTIRLRTKLNTAGLHNCKWFKAPEILPYNSMSWIYARLTFAP